MPAIAGAFVMMGLLGNLGVKPLSTFTFTDSVKWSYCKMFIVCFIYFSFDI